MASIDLESSPQISEAEPSPVKFTRADLGPVALIVASTVGLFWRVIFTSDLFFYRDVSNYTYPTTQFIRELCRSGTLPYWNPYLNYGQAVLGNPNLLFFYPYTLFILALPFDFAYTMHFVLHFALAGVGTYFLARAWGQSRQAAFFAAFIFAFSGPVLSLGNEYNTAACCAWIPWALLAVHHALEKNRLGSWVWPVVIFSLQWLAAEPFTMMATFCLSLAYALYFRGSRDRILSRENIRIFVIFGLMGAAVLMLCAIQFLPASDLLNRSRRGEGMTFTESTIWSLSPLSFLEMLMPNFSGSVLSGPPSWVWLISDENDAYNISNFIGFIPLFFALAGWALSNDRRRKFVAGAMAILFLLTLGHYTPIFALVRLVFPPLTVVRFPMKLLVHVMLLLAILAGWGFDALRASNSRWNFSRQRLTIPLQIFLAATIVSLGIAWVAPRVIEAPILWIYLHLEKVPFTFDKVPDYLITLLKWQLPGLAGLCLGGILVTFGLETKKRWARPGLYILAAVALYQLVSVNIDANPTVAKTFYTYRPPVQEKFTAPKGTYRFISLRDVKKTAKDSQTPNFVSFRGLPGADNFSEIARGALVSRLQLYTGSLYYRVDGSINLDQERALPPFFYDLVIYINQLEPDTIPFNCLLGRMNVKYIISPKPDDTPVTQQIGDVFNGSTSPARLYDDSCFVPRTYVAGNSLFINTSKETLAQLASTQFDATNSAVIAAPEGLAPSVAGTGSAGEAEIIKREPNAITLQAKLSRSGYVMLLDRYDPNWQATLDGRPTTIFRANQIFRAVYAEEGTHTIRFFYRQRGLNSGLAISLATIVGLLIVSMSRLKGKQVFVP